MAAITETKGPNYSTLIPYEGSGAGNLSRTHASFLGSTTATKAAGEYLTFMKLPAGTTIHGIAVAGAASIGTNSTLTFYARPTANPNVDTGISAALTGAVATGAAVASYTPCVPLTLTVESDVVALVGTDAVDLAATVYAAVDYVYKGV